MNIEPLISAMTVSPLSNNSSNPLFLVSSLSDIDPQNNFETKVTAPPGEIPTRALRCCGFYMKKMSFVVVLAMKVFLQRFLWHQLLL